MGTELAVADHTARAHSTVVGGSSAGRVLQCPGSVQLCATYPDIAERITLLLNAAEIERKEPAE